MYNYISIFAVNIYIQKSELSYFFVKTAFGMFPGLKDIPFYTVSMRFDAVSM